MRIRLDISDRVYAKLQTMAAREDLSVSDLLVRSIHTMLRHVRREARRRKPPLIASDRPGCVYLDNEKIYRIIDFP
jgi:hypothetical protein